MSVHEATGRIKITSLPAGELKFWIRQSFIGITFPCYPIIGGAKYGDERGVVSGRPLARTRTTAAVPQDLAMEILSRERPVTAATLRAMGYPQKGMNFNFDRGEFEEVSGTIHQVVREVSDEMMGDPDR